MDIALFFDAWQQVSSWVNANNVAVASARYQSYLHKKFFRAWKEESRIWPPPLLDPSDSDDGPPPFMDSSDSSDDDDNIRLHAMELFDDIVSSSPEITMPVDLDDEDAIRNYRQDVIRRHRVHDLMRRERRYVTITTPIHPPRHQQG